MYIPKNKTIHIAGRYVFRKNNSFVYLKTNYFHYRQYTLRWQIRKSACLIFLHVYLVYFLFTYTWHIFVRIHLMYFWRTYTWCTKTHTFHIFLIIYNCCIFVHIHLIYVGLHTLEIFVFTCTWCILFTHWCISIHTYLMYFGLHTLDVFLFTYTWCFFLFTYTWYILVYIHLMHFCSHTLDVFFVCKPMRMFVSYTWYILLGKKWVVGNDWSDCLGGWKRMERLLDCYYMYYWH